MARKKKTAKKEITLDQLKSYIEGAVEFNDDDWHPNKQQWDKIVEMIMNLKEPEPTIVVSNQQPAPRSQYPNQHQPDNPQQQPIKSTMAETLHQMENPPVNEQGPRPPKIDMRKKLETRGAVPTEAAPAPAPMANKLLPEDKDKVFSSGKTFKTPHIDTSKQNYDSTFE